MAREGSPRRAGPGGTEKWGEELAAEVPVSWAGESWVV